VYYMHSGIACAVKEWVMLDESGGKRGGNSSEERAVEDESNSFEVGSVRATRERNVY
jgi:hypothetical protein